MKKNLLLLAFIPMIGMGQAKTVLTSSRYFCKPDKVKEFEKALGAHAQKYHAGDWKWRVFTIQSGQDAGGYMVSEGPSDWTTLDGRGDITAEHMADWDANVAPLTSNHSSTGYYTFQADKSTVQLTDYADKIVINHIYLKPGKIVAVNELIKKLKKVWEAGSESVAVYAATASGAPEFITVTRLKNGLKELDDNYRKPMMERYNAIYGNGAWEEYLKDYADAVEKRWSELLFYKAALSSK